MSTSAIVGGEAPDFVYANARGEIKQLAQVWAGGPALVLWLRHFG